MTELDEERRRRTANRLEYNAGVVEWTNRESTQTETPFIRLFDPATRIGNLPGPTPTLKPVGDSSPQLHLRAQFPEAFNQGDPPALTAVSADSEHLTAELAANRPQICGQFGRQR